MRVKEKVSIVVPIYKVEKYIHRCLKSILNQTYKNLEIILVNDGSPDGCREIVDQYKQQDRRIHVIHKENGGLSDARNAGMKQVTGNYTMFVDSDDWLAPTMIETMIHYSYTHEADIVQSAFYYAYNDRLLIDERYFNEQDDPITLDNDAVMYELVRNKKVKNFAWGKLYKTALIKDIPFKVGVLFEDVFWAHQVMQHVSTYVLIHDPFYYYYQRDDSIVASYSLRSLDMIKGLKKRHSFIKTYYKDLIDVSNRHMLKNLFIHYHLLLQNKAQDRDGSHRKEIEQYVQRQYGDFKKAVKDDSDLKRQLYLFSMHPYLNLAYLAFVKGLTKIRVLSRPSGLKQVDI